MRLEHRLNLQNTAKNVVLTTALITLASYGFSYNVRKLIKRRDGGCVERSDDCLGGLEASHLDHDQSNPDYNKPDNGETLCTYHHGIYHEESEGANGLPEHQNRWALMTIAGRLVQFLGGREGNQNHQDFIDRNSR